MFFTKVQPNANQPEATVLIGELNDAFHWISFHYGLNSNVDNITGILNFFRKYDSLSVDNFLQKVPSRSGNYFKKIYFFMHKDEKSIKDFLRFNDYNLQQIDLEAYKQKIAIGTKTILNQFITKLEKRLTELSQQKNFEQAKL